jgi:NAD(P)-dependent dehydrogenase (short-subunit alcohol dehydrogenase family)
MLSPEVIRLDMSKKDWNNADIPDQTGKVAVVTGANSGIGFETARALALKGAEVVLACRDLDKGSAAVRSIWAEEPGALVRLAHLDLADLDSVQAFVAEFNSRYDGLHLLVNNAGVMYTPLSRTAQGFEQQFGVNYLAHFALTGLLLESIQRVSNGRVVTVASMVHRWGRLTWDNLNAEKGYNKYRAYWQSKLANLIYAYELQRRFERSGFETISLAAHPGWANTNLQTYSLPLKFFSRYFSQSAVMGALPTLYAACSSNASGGDYYGPDGFMELKGSPVKVHSSNLSHDPHAAQKLWNVSQRLTGVHY